MSVQSGEPAEEIKRLQRCINDLVSVLTLPAMWTGAEPSKIVHILLDALLSMLQLDLVYVRLNETGGQAAIEMVRFAESQKRMAEPNEIGDAFKQWLAVDLQEWPAQMREPIGNREISIIPLGLGLQGEIGVIVAGAERADFPQQTEKLILRVAVNQASIALQEARLRSEQKRVASELDRRVAQRTAELVAANEELQLQAGLLQRLPVSAWTLNPDGTPDVVNQVWLEFSGQSLDFVRSNPEAWMTAVHPDDREQASRAFWEGIRSGQDFTFETRSLHAGDGTYRWHLQQAVVLRDADGKVLKFVGTTTDIDDQKRAEEKLRESEYESRLVVDSIPAQISVVSASGEMERANQTVLDYYGRSLEEFSDWATDGTVHPGDLAWYVRAVRHSLTTGDPFEQEVRTRRFDGVYRWFEVRGRPLRDHQGKILRWYFLQTDIDDRKRAEEDFRSDGERHRVVVETAPDAVISMDDGGTIQFANPATKRIFGYDPTELIGQPLTVLMPEFLRGRHETGFKRYLATGQRHINWQGTELTALRKNGQEFPVEISFGELTRDGHKVFTGFVRDISGRKQAEDKLRASERSLRELTETIPQMLWSAEADGTIDYCNRRALEYIGLDAEGVSGADWAKPIHADDIERMFQAWTAAVSTGEPFQCEFRMRRAVDQSYRLCFSSALPLRDQKGQVIKWFGSVVDLHDWKEAQQALHAIQTRQVAVRADVSLAFGRNEGLDAILHECAETIVRHLDAAFARIWTLSRDGRMLELRASAGIYTHLNGAHSRIPIGELKIGAIAREQKHVLTNDIINDPRISDKTWAANEGMSSFAGYPLLGGTRTLGVLAMFSRKPLTTGTAEALASVADLIASGIERKHAEDELRESERNLQMTQAELARVSRLTTMGELAASIAHEVNQPLTAVVSNARSLTV